PPLRNRSSVGQGFDSAVAATGSPLDALWQAGAWPPAISPCLLSPIILDSDSKNKCACAYPTLMGWNDAGAAVGHERPPQGGSLQGGLMEFERIASVQAPPLVDPFG